MARELVVVVGLVLSQGCCLGASVLSTWPLFRVGLGFCGFFFFFFVFSRAIPAACGGSQARGRIRAIAAGLRQSHSNMGSELHLQPTPQLTAMLDP